MNQKVEHDDDVANDNHEHPSVEFVYLNTNAEVKFHAKWDEKLSLIWDNAYNELHEIRRPNDLLECQSGDSLMLHLELTLQGLRERKICKARKFQIRSETGGA